MIQQMTGIKQGITNDGLRIKRPDNLEFSKIKELIKAMWLDDSNLNTGDFLLLKHNDAIIAFGRIRDTGDALELCTLGVVKKYRGLKLGTRMVNELISLAGSDVYAVTVIPAFFKKAGFKIMYNYPPSILVKYELCTVKFYVGKDYKVMKYSKRGLPF
jgi:N-acetylglutamate synthase-like GNAT family acetyltransferase